MGQILFEGTDKDVKSDGDDGIDNFGHQYDDQERMIGKLTKQGKLHLHWVVVEMSELTMKRGNALNREEGVIVRMDESVEDEEWGVKRQWVSLAFSLHSFDQYRIEVHVEILDQRKC